MLCLPGSLKEETNKFTNGKNKELQFKYNSVKQDIEMNTKRLALLAGDLKISPNNEQLNSYIKAEH